MQVSQAQVTSVVICGVFVGFAVNVLSGHWAGHKLTFSTLGALVAVLAFLVPSDGLLRRSRHGRTRGVRLLAVILVVVYPLVTGATAAERELVAVLLPAVFLWLASSLLLWTSSSADFGHVAVSCSFLLGAVAGLQFGATALLVGQGLAGATFLVLGTGLAGLSVGLLLNSTFLLGVALLLIGAGFMPGGLAALVGPSTLYGVAVMLFGLGVLLVGAGVLLSQRTLRGVAALLVGSAALLLGVGMLLDGRALLGFAAVLLGMGGLVGGVALLVIRSARPGTAVPLFGVSLLLVGSALLLTGVKAGLEGSVLYAVADLLAGVMALLFGLALLLGVAALSHLQRAWAWLRQTTPRAPLDSNPLGPADPQDTSTP